MLELTETKLRTWANRIGVENLALAEQDYRLLTLLEILYSQDLISKKLLMKGGTALNKLYLKETSRLSVDLDFNHVGGKNEVLRERPELRETLVTILKEQDDTYRVSFKRNYNQTTVKAKYSSLTSVNQQLKLEISHIERIPIVEPVVREAISPQMSFGIATYSLEELLATKLRALFERFAGRDIYDLYFTAKLAPNKLLIKKMFLYYFYRSRKVYDPKTHFEALRERLDQRKYVDDVRGFVRPSVSFSLEDAADFVISEYSMLTELDDSDERFLSIAKVLLRKGQVSKQLQKETERIMCPLADLLDGFKITKDAAAATRKDIAVF